MSWDLITPFVRPLEPLLHDVDITDILVNGSGAVFIEKNGRLSLVAGLSIPEKSLQVAVRNIARLLGDEIDEQHPILEARLPDGSRLTALFPPCSVGGTTLAIRKFQTKRYDLEGLLAAGAVTPAVLKLLEDAITRRDNIVVSGRTGAGKTTLLMALAAFLPAHERLIVIEDVVELQIAHANLVRLEARKEQPGLPPVTMRQLLRASLRLRPDRILLGEIRGAEAFELLQAFNTGHRGTLSTTHADTAALTLERLTTCALMSDVQLPHPVICRQIGLGLQWIVHMDVRDGRRQVIEMARLKGYDMPHDRYDVEVVYAV